MTKLRDYLLGAVILAALGWWAYSSFVTKPEAEQRHRATSLAENTQRFNDWAYVAKEKEIRPGETVKLVVLPHPWGEFMDTKCLVYTNREFKTASMICPDAKNNFIADKDQP